jgi:hypothetical protein
LSCPKNLAGAAAGAAGAAAAATAAGWSMLLLVPKGASRQPIFAKGEETGGNGWDASARPKVIAISNLAAVCVHRFAIEIKQRQCYVSWR